MKTEVFALIEGIWPKNVKTNTELKLVWTFCSGIFLGG